MFVPMPKLLFVPLIHAENTQNKLCILTVLNTVSSGFSIILCTVLAAGLGALAAPVPDEPSGAPDGEVA